MTLEAARPAPTPPAFLKLAAHPLRWRLLSELARSDRMVNELTRLTGEPQNLVSYHLAKLRDGRLVSSRRSAADGRDSYYGLNLARVGRQLSATGGALHPGLRLAPPQQDDAPTEACSILFLCTGNSARSQMAEALARSLSGGVVDAHSAGSHPKTLHPNAIRVMAEDYGLDITTQRPKPVDLYASRPFDWVVSLCDKVREACPELSDRPQAIHWSLPNPAADGDDEATYPLFRRTAAELETRIRFLLARLTERPASEDPGDSDDRPQ